MKLFLSGLLILACAFCHAQIFDESRERSRILELEYAWNQAVLQNDAKALEPLLGNELIYIDDDGAVMNKAAYLASIRSPQMRFQHIASDSMRVQFFGRIAVVIGIYTEKGLKNGKPYLLHERFVDTWANETGAWMCVASQSTLIQRYPAVN